MLRYANSLLVHGSLLALCWLFWSSSWTNMEGTQAMQERLKTSFPGSRRHIVSNWSILHAQRPAFTIAPWHLFEQVVEDANIAYRIGYCIFCTAALILRHSSQMTRFSSFKKLHGSFLRMGAWAVISTPPILSQGPCTKEMPQSISKSLTSQHEKCKQR